MNPVHFQSNKHDWEGLIRFLPGRLKFVGAKHPAPFPSMIVVFKPHKK